jgi:hypothetical protein
LRRATKLAQAFKHKQTTALALSVVDVEDDLIVRGRNDLNVGVGSMGVGSAPFAGVMKGEGSKLNALSGPHPPKIMSLW